MAEEGRGRSLKSTIRMGASVKTIQADRRFAWGGGARVNESNSMRTSAGSVAEKSRVCREVAEPERSLSRVSTAEREPGETKRVESNRIE